MITESFDSKTKPIPSLEDFYGEQKHIITKCLIIFSKEIHGYILSNFDFLSIGFFSIFLLTLKEMLLFLGF